MSTVTSADGTTIAYDTTGSGPAIVLVGGAFCDRNFARDLTGHLQDEYTVYNYDRRGRGESADTEPYAVSREIEDLEAVIAAAGGSALVFGVSSGAILALEAAAAGAPITKLALVEPPYTVDDSRPPFHNMAAEYTKLCAEGRPGDAVELFMTKAVGQPQEMADQMRQSPMWPALEALAPTLAYDASIVDDAVIPERFSAVKTPALLIESTDSTEWLKAAARAVAQTLPSGSHESISGQFHQPSPELMATVLKRFFS